MNLAVGDLRDSGLSSSGLNLTIADLADSASLGGSLNLAISGGRDLSRRSRRAATGRSDDVDSVTLVTLRLVVQVVEGSAQALVEDGTATESNRAISTEREAGSVDGTSLYWVVKLELSVGSDVTSSARLVLEDAVGEAEGQGTSGGRLSLQKY